MDLEILIIGIIMPILLGPFYVILKELWDNYTGKNQEIKKNIYNEKIKVIKDKLTLFYWPIYIKLCCLYHFNYNIIEENTISGEKILPYLMNKNEIHDIDTFKDLKLIE